MEDRERLDRLTETIIGVAIDVHRTLGPGLLESVYESCLSINFDVTNLQRGIRRVVNAYPDSLRPLRPSAASAWKSNES